MNALMRSEILKLRTLHSTWIVTAVAGLLSSIIGVAMVRISVTNPPSDGHRVRASEVAMGPVQALWFLAVGLAIVASAGEFQHRTMRTTLLLTPSRKQVLLAKAVVSGGLGAALVTIGVVAATGAGWVTATVSHVSLSTGSVLDWSWVAAAVALGLLWSVLAVGLGVLTRSTAVAITTLLLWRFVGEGVLPVITGHPNLVARWTPTGAGNALIGAGDSTLLPVWGAALLFAGYATAVCASAAIVFTHRDPS